MKKTMYYYVGFVIALILLVGCAPVKTTYYKPLIDDGYYKGPCGGPDNYGATRLNTKLAYFVYVSTDNNNGVSATNVGINFKVYPGSILTLASGSIILSGINYHAEVPIGTIHKREWKPAEKKLVETEFSFSDQLIGYPETNIGAVSFNLSEIQKWGGFSFELAMPPYWGDEFTVKLPSMKLDGEVVNSRELKVRKVTEHYWMFIC